MLEVDIQDLEGRGRTAATVRARKILAALGAEWYGLKVKAMAEVLGKHPVTASGWVMRGIRRRQNDPEFQVEFEELDRLQCET